MQEFQFPQGATPIHDCSGLIPPWVHHIHDLNRVEAENIIDAQRKYLASSIDNPKNWFCISNLKDIHRAMFGNVWRWAGSYRQSPTSIGIKPNLIPSHLAEFCFEVISWLEHPVELTFVEMAAKIHHRLVWIHPFENGNGRFARLVADRFLASFRCQYPLWPNQLNQNGTMRNDYIQTLKNADQGDHAFLIDFMKILGATDPTLCEFIKKSFYKPYVKDEKGRAMVKAFLRNGCNPNDQTLNGHRVLQLAIQSGLEKIVKELVDGGADINIMDRSGLTPFQTAVIKGNKGLADYLLSKGAKRQIPPGLGYARYYELYRNF
jgi:Fic-DOC domain mobile mystery protein B